MPAVPRGRFVWHELLTTAPDAATDFYRKVIGWSVTTWEHNPSYRLLTMKDAPMAGLMELPEEARAGGAPPHWLTYVSVPDVDATVARATALGGRVYAPAQEVPTVGRFAVLADPQGAVFAAFKPVMEPTGPEEATIGDFSWHELATSNWQAGWDFYHELFGWEHESSFDMGPDGTYWMFRRPGTKPAAGGMFTMPPQMAAPPHWMPYILVPNADRATELTQRHGGKVLSGPMDIPGGDRIAQLLDPQGGAFAVHARQAVTKPAAKKKAPKATKAKSRPKPKAKKTAARKRVRRKPVKKKKSAPKRSARRRTAKKKTAKKTRARKPRRPATKKTRRTARGRGRKRR